MRILVLSAVFILHCTLGLALKPSKKYTKTPHDLRMKHDKLKINSTSGIILNAWYFPSGTGDQLLIMSHDGVGNMGEYLERIRIFVNYGFSVMAYDYRGFGESSDFEIENTTYIYKEFYEDFDAIYNYCIANYNMPLFAYGWGIGGGISIASGFQKSKIIGIIADDPFVDFDALKRSFRSINAIMHIPTEVQTPALDPIDVVQNKPGKYLGGILFFHGEKNFLVTKNDMQLLFDRVNLENKEVVYFKHASVMDNFSVNESEYARRIYGFAINL